MTEQSGSTSHRLDRRDIAILVLTPVVSVFTGKAFDLPLLALAALAAFSCTALAIWLVARWMVRLRGDFKSLQEWVAAQGKEVERDAKDVARHVEKQQHDLWRLNRRIELLTAASVPSWLLTAMTFAERSDWSVRIVGNAVKFEHDWRDPASLVFPLGEWNSCRDELFDHLGPRASSFLARTLDTKRIGEGT